MRRTSRASGEQQQRYPRRTGGGHYPTSHGWRDARWMLARDDGEGRYALYVAHVFALLVLVRGSGVLEAYITEACLTQALLGWSVPCLPPQTPTKLHHKKCGSRHRWAARQRRHSARQRHRSTRRASRSSRHRRSNRPSDRRRLSRRPRRRAAPPPRAPLARRARQTRAVP